MLIVFGSESIVGKTSLVKLLLGAIKVRNLNLMYQVTLARIQFSSSPKSKECIQQRLIIISLWYSAIFRELFREAV